MEMLSLSSPVVNPPQAYQRVWTINLSTLLLTMIEPTALQITEKSHKSFENLTSYCWPISLSKLSFTMTANSSVKRGRVMILIKCDSIETSAKWIEFGVWEMLLCIYVHYSFEVKAEFHATWKKITQKSIVKIC